LWPHGSKGFHAGALTEGENLAGFRYYVLNMVEKAPSEDLSLHEVADELGVHYMTAYRYVRIGMLLARKEGRTWRVSRADLDAMLAEPESARAGDGTPWAERLRRRLIAGDEAGAWKVIEAALVGGTSPGDVLEDIITPAMHRIGELWEEGAIGVDGEHIASAVCIRLMGRLGSRFARRGLSRGTVVMGTTEHELHGIPSALVSDVLRLSGFDVVDLGPKLPAADFSQAAKRVPQLVAVGVSATVLGQEDALAETVRALRSAVDVPIFLGGRAVRSRDQALGLGADGWAATASDLVDLIGEASG
jgi:excisionase family DNA binding protein